MHQLLRQFEVTGKMLVSAKDGDGKTAVWKFLVGVGVPEENADMAVKEAIDVESNV